jgi:hypothetical protein
MREIEQTPRIVQPTINTVPKIKQINAALLARLRRELTKPRLVKSVRERKRVPKVFKIEQPVKDV